MYLYVLATSYKKVRCMGGVHGSTKYWVVLRRREEREEKREEDFKAWVVLVRLYMCVRCTEIKKKLKIGMDGLAALDSELDVNIQLTNAQ